jgi:DNA-binding winged helix-turn-helix (wHTH) protein/Tol biopolymer transport system component
MPENVPGLRVVPPERHIRFGPFELDSRVGELRKHGIKIRIGQQTFEILLMLLRRPGELVLREEIRQKLWPLDTVVEFDHSINAAIQKLRDALGESAGDPRYIETLPRRGYRFIGTVEMPPVEPATEEPPPEAPIVEAAPRNWSPRMFTAAVVILGALALAGWLRPWEARAPVRNLTASLGAIGEAVVSPDGTAVLYRDSRGLFLRRLDSLEETPIYTQDRLTDTPAWSLDGSRAVFATFLGITRFLLPNGPAAVLWPKAPITRGFAWAPDGSILAATLPDTGEGNLYLVSPEGGTPVRLGVPGLRNGRFYYPEFLPDGKTILFAWDSDHEELGLYLATLENGKLSRGPVLLRRNMTAGHYSPAGGGQLMYVQDDKLYAQKLNIRRGTLEGEPERVVDGVLTTLQAHHARFSVSRDGVLVWTAGRAALAQLTWFDRKGKVLGTAGPPCLPETVRLSPDEEHVLAYTVTDHAGYSIVEANHSGYVSLPGMTRAPLWMPNSSHIVYARNEGSSYRVLERAAGGGAEKELRRVAELDGLRDISADGKVLIYRWEKKLFAVRLDGPQEIASPPMVAETVNGRLSPDGRWVVYTADLGSRRQEAYAQPVLSGGLRTQLTSAGATRPIWRGDGKEILYLNGSTIYSLRVEVKGNTIHTGPPEALFDVRVPTGIVGYEMPMAVTRDGSRILFAQGVEQPNPQLTYVMTAWESLLKK